MPVAKQVFQCCTIHVFFEMLVCLAISNKNGVFLFAIKFFHELLSNSHQSFITVSDSSNKS